MAIDTKPAGSGDDSASGFEKPMAEMRENASFTNEIHDPDAGKSDEERAELDRKLLRKMDLTLIPWLCFLYLVSFLDRTNIGNAKVAHLTKDISMTTTMFNHTLTIFFVSYSLFEPLANVLLKRMRPSRFIPLIMFLWGCTMLGMGFVKNWDGLMAARWFLGLTEAGLFPGVSYYLSCWYKRSEFGVRLAIFFSSAAIAGSFGGLLAAGISKMDGIGGHPGWAWIFILEGGLTVVVGLLSFFFVHDFPSEAKFLTDDERARVLYRLASDNQSSSHDEKFKWKFLWQALKDWKMYSGMLVYMGALMPMYSFSLFLPTIISSMSFTTADSVIRNQLLSVPPYILAALTTMVCGLWSDRSGRRGIFQIPLGSLAIVGFIMVMASSNPAVQYTGTFLAAAGTYALIPISLAWIANNIEGMYKRGITMGFVIGWGNLNGIVSSNVYFNDPKFYEGHGTVLGYFVICTIMGSAITMYLLNRENRLRREGKRDHWVENKTALEIHEMGDNRPDFFYVI
ncbi:hypothetical protein TD95_000832 [Thielaviopsis punctulata]|uniref:Major facilitator superfamily (MFS) profile domain-containing protein n=1 Tax=Thielaviopsis punctulata TaxID=72032 RepID=A0A0F4ZKF1_9PEZI|nr:hypothetical protein TD95_000832 [Thielaviopsis punctulata]